MKTQQQRIADAADVLRREQGYRPIDQLAKRMLDAADREPPTPTWPTDESVDAALKCPYPNGRSSVRNLLHAAMLADPIIQAAIDYRDACDYPRRDASNMRSTGLALRAEVKRAGL